MWGLKPQLQWGLEGIWTAKSEILSQHAMGCLLPSSPLSCVLLGAPTLAFCSTQQRCTGGTDT